MNNTPNLMSTSLQTYGNDQNPFIDGIPVNIVQNGNMTATQQFVLTRSSTIDNDFNMNSTVIFNLMGNSIVMTFSNQSIATNQTNGVCFGSDGGNRS